MTTGFLDATTTSYYLTGVSAGTAIPITMPATVAPGDTLFMFHSSGRVMTTPSGWTGILTGAGRSWYRIADGTEAGTTVDWHAGSTGDYQVHAVVMRYHFVVPFTTPIGNSDTWAYGDETDGTKTAHKDFTDAPPTKYEIRLYVVANTHANLNHHTEEFGTIGEPKPAGPVTWTSATQRYLDNDSANLGSVSTVLGSYARCDLLSVADRLVAPGESPGSEVDVELSPDGGQVGNGYGVRLSFSEPPFCLTFRSSTSAEYTSYATDGEALGFPGDFLIDATTTQFVIDKPAGVVAGDILVFGFHPAYEASPNRFSSGQYLTITGPGTWTTHLLPLSSVLAWVCWKVAGVDEPASYTVEIHNNFDGSIVPAYGLMLMGAWSGSGETASELDLHDPSLFGSSFPGSQWSRCFRNFPPDTTDLASCGITGTEVLTGDALVVYFVGARCGYQNGLDTSTLPASIPWVNVAIDAPVTQHADNHYEGLPDRHDGTQAPSSSTRTLAGHRSWLMGSENVPSGTIPDRSASFTWQHTSAMLSHSAFVYRLVLLCGEEVLTPYWGILASTSLPL